MTQINDYLNKIHLGDCMDILRQLPDKSVDLVLTDPPYFGIVKNDWDNQWTDLQHFCQWVKMIGFEISRVLKDNGAFYWFGDDKIIAYCQVELDTIFNLLNNIVWYKEGCRARKGARSVYRSYAPVTERILFYEKYQREIVRNNPGVVYITQQLLQELDTTANARKFIVNTLKLDSAMINRWFDGDSFIAKKHYEQISEYFNGRIFGVPYTEIKKQFEGNRRTWINDTKAFDVLHFPFENQPQHPTQKPVSLISYLIERASNPNDIILDPFSGSGTTAVACHNLGRQFICVEKDPEYHAASVKRLEQAQKNQFLF